MKQAAPHLTAKRADAKAAAERLEVLRLAAVAKHDRGAFDELYRDYYPRLMDFLARLVAHNGLSEEVVNDTMYVVCWPVAGVDMDFRDRLQTGDKASGERGTHAS
jgi:hypothetical protein